MIDTTNPVDDVCSGSEAGSHLRLMDSCSTQFEAQGPFRTCNESKEEEQVMTLGFVKTHNHSVDYEGSESPKLWG